MQREDTRECDKFPGCIEVVLDVEVRIFSCWWGAGFRIADHLRADVGRRTMFGRSTSTFEFHGPQSRPTKSCADEEDLMKAKWTDRARLCRASQRKVKRQVKTCKPPKHVKPIMPPWPLDPCYGMSEEERTTCASYVYLNCTTMSSF